MTIQRKGAVTKRLMLAAFITFISGSVLGEGKYVFGYESLEVRSAFNDMVDEGSALGMTTEFTLDKPLASYLRFGELRYSAASSKAISPYLLMSITQQLKHNSFETAADNLSDSISEITYGIGADFNVSDDTTINVEYVDYIDGGKMETSGFSFGSSWTF